MPPPSPISSLLATLFLFLVSSTIINDDYGGIIISVDASRAYPHGCLYRHPSYYTYDERDDISWFTGGQNHHHHHDGELTTATSLTSETVQEESEFSDYRFLPPASHPIRRSYHQYKLLRRLGAGKFSNVFEAVDILAVANAAAVAAMKKKRKKKIASIQEDATNNETTDTSSSDNESSITTSTTTTTTTIDPNTLVVLKCLKPISERKIRRELLVLTHCRDLPNLARLIGIVIPSSMDGDEKIMKKKNERDGEMEVEVMKKEEVGGGSRKDHYHRRQYHHYQEQQQLQQQSNHHARKRRRNNHRMSRQLHHKQQPLQQQHRQQDIGSITTDAAVDAASRQRGLSNNSNRGNNSSIKHHHHGTTNTSSTKHNTLHQRNEAVKDVNLTNKKNGNTSNTNNGNSSQHGEQVPALVLEHAGQTAQWFCHGSRPSFTTTTTTNTEGKDYRPTTNIPHHNKYSYQNHLTEYEIKYYLCHLLIALDGLHAAGIMHRDVKPRNTLINLSEVPVFSSAERRRMRKGISATNALQSTTSFESSTASTTLLPPQPLMLVDLGLADFYLPGKEFNVRVASRHYKSPELLIGYEYYDYAIDMWSVGCILAGLLFRTEPFFRGVDNEDQLGRIVNCLGTRDFLPYCRKCNVRLSSKARAAIGKYCSESSSLSSSSSEDAPISLTNSDIGRRKPWLSYLTSDCPLPSSEATDLLDKLLVYDHEQRWTAREALSHSFFDEVRDEVWSEVQERILWESRDDRCKQDAALNR